MLFINFSRLGVIIQESVNVDEKILSLRIIYSLCLGAANYVLQIDAPFSYGHMQDNMHPHSRHMYNFFVW